MFIRSILLLSIAFIAAHGANGPMSIDSDAARITNLYSQYVSNQNVSKMLGQMRQSCSWLAQCCSNEFARFTSLMLDNVFFEQCLNTATQMGGTCAKAPFSRPTTPRPSQEQRAGVRPDGKLAKHILPWVKRTESVCTPSELQSFYCDSNAVNTFQSCQIRTLQAIAQENNDYVSFVNGLEEDLTAFFNEVINRRQ